MYPSDLPEPTGAEAMAALELGEKVFGEVRNRLQRSDDLAP